MNGNYFSDILTILKNLFKYSSDYSLFLLSLIKIKNRSLRAVGSCFNILT